MTEFNYEALLPLIPLVIPVIVNYLKEKVGKNSLPFVAVGLGVVLTVATKYVSPNELELIQVLINGVIQGLGLGAAGVGVFELKKRVDRIKNGDPKAQVKNA